jgi:hypothetical protein
MNYRSQLTSRTPLVVVYVSVLRTAGCGGEYQTAIGTSDTLFYVAQTEKERRVE